MKQFIQSRIFRKMIILAVFASGLVFVGLGENTRAARNTTCCTRCEEIAAYCATHYGGPNDPYKEFKQCVAGEGGQDCLDGICDPYC
jgi:hypothetical protein